MNVLDAINTMLGDTSTTKTSLAQSLGRSKQSISNMFAKKTDVYTDTLIKMADHMGYKLILENGENRIVLTAREK
ncbi:plasmid maintenance system antidote protein [Eggerthella sp. YY7918]|nr:plasmid maintenance system antidote protein [Eggerthella sp. YY7918]